MFTGIVQGIGTVIASDLRGRDLRLSVDATSLAPRAVNIGDSVAVDGVCLTVVNNREYCLRFDVSAETLSVSTLGRMVVGSKVNLELALTVLDRFGGHFVTGHVDGTAKLDARAAEGDSEKLVFSVPAELSRYISKKGSICVDGVSLTVNAVTADGFTVNLVPHTLRATNLGEIREGQSVNLEVDMVARYLERLVGSNPQPQKQKPRAIEEKGDEGDAEPITKQFLSQHGFMAPDIGPDEETSDSET